VPNTGALLESVCNTWLKKQAFPLKLFLRICSRHLLSRTQPQNHNRRRDGARRKKRGIVAFSRTARRTTTALVLAVAIGSAVSGCGTPPWEQGTETEPTSIATPTATPEPIEAVINDLATGSSHHVLTAGAISLTADYYSTLSMEQWTAGAVKPITFNVAGTLADDQGQEVYLSQMTATASVNGPNGALPAPAAFVDRATIQYGYAIKPPFTYGQTYNILAIDPAATSITVVFTYELLLETTETSSQFAKQTATDSLTITIAPTP
jgi:hypothetical protein